MYKAAAHVSAISAFTLNGPKQLFGLPDGKTSVIHAGVNYERFAQPADTSFVRAKYGKDTRIILGIGALKARKGFDIVIRAMKQVCIAVPNTVYVIVGQGSDEASLRSMVQELGLEKQVFFETNVTDALLPAYVHAADVYCHTPRMVDGAFEGFGIVYLQAGSAGKPVVGARSGGVPDAVVDGETGFLVPENNVDATAAALIKILQIRNRQTSR